MRIVQQLPPLQPHARTELVDQISTVPDQISQILQRLPRASLDAPRSTEHDAEFTRQYLSFVSDTMDQLELFGVDVRRYHLRTSVTVAYLGLTVTTSGRLPRRPDVPELWSDDRAVPRSEDGLRVEQALATSSRTLLRGLAGSGKTTLLQWIAVNAARRSFTGPLARWNGLVPFFVRLRSYPDAKLPQPQDMIAGTAGPIADQAPESWAHRQFIPGRALLLVDGVDELRAERRPRVRQWLSHLLAVYPKTEVVVTSRPGAAEANWLSDNGFGSLLLEPMAPADVTIFCRHWHNAVRKSGSLPVPVPELDEYEAALQRNLDARRHLRTLATNPLLCAMLCALNIDRRKQLPPDRMQLYAAALDLLIERRDAEREIPAQMALDGRTKITILQHLAWWLTLNGRTEATVPDALELLAQAITQMPEVHTDPEQTLRYLVERSGILREPVTGRVDFVHRTFQEYLAGKQAAEQHHAHFLARNAHLDQWRDTVIMGAGHCSVPLRGMLLNTLLDRADREPRQARRLKLVAAACLETTHSVDPAIAGRIEAALDKLIPPRRKVEARSLTVAGERLLRRLPRALDELTPASAAACVRAVALTGGPDALTLLAGYATDERYDVQTELAKSWKYFPAETYAKTVLAHAPLRGGTIEVDRVDQIPQLRHLTNLRRSYVVLGQVHEISSLDFLRDAIHLSWLDVDLPPDLILDLGPLAEHIELSAIKLHCFTTAAQCTRPEALANLPLSYLSMDISSTTTDLDFVRPLTTVETLYLNNCVGLRDCSALTDLPNLKELSLWGVANLRDVEFIGELTQLSELGLSGLPGSSWHTPLAAVLPSLDRLNLAVTSLRDLGLLAGSGLTRLDLQWCPVSDLSPLVMVPTLRQLVLRKTDVTDLSPLAELPALKCIDLGGGETTIDLNTLAGATRRLELRLAQWQQVRGVERLGPNVRVKRY